MDTWKFAAVAPDKRLFPDNASEFRNHLLGPVGHQVSAPVFSAIAFN